MQNLNVIFSIFMVAVAMGPITFLVKYPGFGVTIN